MDCPRASPPRTRQNHPQKPPTVSFLLFFLFLLIVFYVCRYATIFWADSVSYLKAPGLQPCMHRVGKSTKERYSVVFKQRTSTLTTPCRYPLALLSLLLSFLHLSLILRRYQEDYILADIQKKAVQHKDSQSGNFFTRHPLVLGSMFSLPFFQFLSLFLYLFFSILKLNRCCHYRSYCCRCLFG